VLAQATRHDTPCGDGSIVWHSWGNDAGGGEPLVLLHGGSGSWTHWLRNVEVLAAAGRRVLVPDLPGFGDSAVAPTGHDADAIVDPLANGLRQLLGDAPSDICGFSFGGLTGGLLAAAHPQRVRQLVLAGAPGLGLRDRRLPLTSWRHLESQAERETAHRSNLAALMLHNPESIDALAVALQSANVTRDRLRARRLAMTNALALALEKIRCPVDAIYGDKDVLYLDKHAALEAALKAHACFGELLFVPEAGHWVQFERAEAFNRALLGLLSRERTSR